MRPTLIALSLLAACPALLLARSARADILIDDFEDVSDWSNLVAETTEVHAGAGAGRWEDHVAHASIKKAFTPALDTTAEHLLQFWIYSGTANGALIELILDSENEADPAGSDYYRFQITADWQGWRYFRIAKEQFGIARNPIGWNEINSIAFSASGWGHDPLADTLLILDDMSFGVGVLAGIQTQSGFQGSDYVYDFMLDLEERTGAARNLSFAISGAAGNPFTLDMVDASVNLPANGTGQAHARITVPAAAISDATLLDLHEASVLVTDQGATCDGTTLSAAVPLPPREHPRTLLDAEDFTRISALVGQQAWAASARDGIVNAADGWPASFESEYGLSAWQLPPEGGQWTLWYVCPVHGVRLQNEGPTSHVCPVDNHVYSGWPYDQVVYSWMHSDLAGAARDLGLAYQFTGDVGYAEKSAEILLAYADGYAQYPIHDVNGGEGESGARVLSQTLDESGWLIPIAWAYDLIADSPALTDPERAHIADDLLRASVATIQRHPAGQSNWQSWHNAGMGAVGFALEDPALIARTIRGNQGFEFQMQKSVSADGFWYEGSWGYHFYALDALMQLAEMSTRAGYDLYEDAALRSMFEAPLLFAMPNATLPAFNDSGSSNLISNDRFYEAAYARYQEDIFATVLGKRNRGRNALFWGEAELPSVANLTLTSHLFPDAGYAVMRAGAGDDATYLALDFGPHGGGHGHYDKLGFVLFGRGAVMGIDPGTQSYAAPTHKTWDKETVAHNTVVIDETTQAEATGALHRFEALPDLTLTSADAGEAYATASLMRTMVMAPEYVVDQVRVVATDGAEHDVDWVYHNTGFMQSSLPLASYSGFPSTGGYQHLSGAEGAVVADAWDVSFGYGQQEQPYGGAWGSVAGIVASFDQTKDQAHAGSWSGKMSYDFSQATGYIIFSTERPEEQTAVPDTLRLAVYGDGSGHELSVRVYDDTNERFVHTVGVVDWQGWRELEVPGIATWDHYLGNDDGVFDSPVREVGIQVAHQAGGPATGALYVDDIVLGYPGIGDVVVADFEIPSRAIGLHMLGGAGTTVVAGEGLGPDLLEPVPFVMARRRATETTFQALLSPFGDAPVVTAFSSIATDAAPADQAGAWSIEGPAFQDRLLAVADGAPGVLRTFGDHRCDGVVCFARRDPSGALLRLALVGGLTLSDATRPLVEAQDSLSGMQVDYADAGTRLLLSVRVAIATQVRILGPDVTEVLVNGVVTDYTRDGDYVVLNLEATLPDGGAPGGDSGVAGGDGGVEGGSGPGASSSGGGDDGGGCGCRTAPRRSTSPPWAALWLLVTAFGLRRRAVAVKNP